MTLSTVVIAFESEEAARRRLEAFGYAPEVAEEIAVYLAQSTDLTHIAVDIVRAFGGDGLQAEFVALDALPKRLRELAPRREETIVWALTDGVRFYRGSSVPALTRLEGFARFGSGATAAHLAQDKFASFALASAAGLAVPPTMLMEGETGIASLGPERQAQPLFVKPNTLGAKSAFSSTTSALLPRRRSTAPAGYGTDTAIAPSYSRLSKATTSGRASWIAAAPSPIRSA